ncbi:type II toxin-antitoxin system RelE/ParE family toxin [Crenothrix sp.]|uniref:type II toxin-antitoxin system RelE/ParE family toxin n=1 Tax=Crenothrix sp. TaxID=3100433 RepID=UPI00374D2E5F
MSIRIHFRPEAESDIEEAATWHGQQPSDPGNELLDENLSICQIISENPNLYPIIHKQTRPAVIHRFPFGIYYRIEKELIVVVVAVMHGSRHAKRWQKRI